MTTPAWPEVKLEVLRDGALRDDTVPFGEPGYVVNLFTEARVAVMASTLVEGGVGLGRKAVAVAITARGSAVDEFAEDEPALELLGPRVRAKLEEFVTKGRA